MIIANDIALPGTPLIRRSGLILLPSQVNAIGNSVSFANAGLVSFIRVYRLSPTTTAVKLSALFLKENACSM